MATASRISPDAVQLPTTRRYLPLMRWGALCALLIGEVLFLSYRFDTAALSKIDSTWADLFGHVSLLGQFGLCVAAALFIFGGHQLGDLWQQIIKPKSAATIPWLALSIHAAAFFALYQLSVKVFDGNLQQSAAPVEWLIAWLSAGLLVLASWICMALPTAQLRSIAVRALGKTIAFGAVIAVLAIGAGQLAELLWQPLGKWTLWIASKPLGFIYGDVIVDSAEMVLGTKKFSVRIAPGCSGYEGIGLISVFLSAFLWWFRAELRFPQSLLLLPIGGTAIWLANALRIVAMIVVGNAMSPTIAAEGFHSQAGWLAFNAVTLALIAVAWNSPFFSKAAATSDSEHDAEEYPSAPYLVPFLVLMGSTMLTAALSSGGFDRLYPVRVVAAGTTLIFFIHTFRQQKILQWSISLSAVAMGALVFGIWMLLERLSGTNASVRSVYATHLATMPGPMAAGWIVLRAVGAVVVVPLAEELAFRGYLIRRLQAVDFTQVPMGAFSWISFVGSSICFGALHGRFVAATLAGMAYALVLYRRGRLMDAVVAHATTNLLIFACVLGTGDWSLWS